MAIAAVISRARNAVAAATQSPLSPVNLLARHLSRQSTPAPPPLSPAISQVRSASTRPRATSSNADRSFKPERSSKPEHSSKPERRLHRFSYIVAPDQLQPGMKVMNCGAGGGETSAFAVGLRLGMLDPLSQIGNSLPMGDMRIGTFVHCVEHRPGEGAKFVRAAGTSAKIMKIGDGRCVLKMPSGVEKIFDARCRATIGRVSNPERKHDKLHKAGESRWRGRRPVVRGVAMNPIDHPHGGGEGKTSGGRPSVTPWGKPTKSGYKTVLHKNHIVRESSSGKKKKGNRG